jgi:hypothetical protein
MADEAVATAIDEAKLAVVVAHVAEEVPVVV